MAVVRKATPTAAFSLRHCFSFLMHTRHVLHLGSSNDIHARSQGEIERYTIRKNRLQAIADYSISNENWIEKLIK